MGQAGAKILPLTRWASVYPALALLSAGFSVLPEELCGARPEPVEDSRSHSHPPIVSDEDLSVGHSALQDCVPRADGDSSAAPLAPHHCQEQVRHGLSGTLLEEPSEKLWEERQQEYL